MTRKRVLAIDGGGIRGIIPAVVLADLERRTGKPVAELFDLVAGTSTGAILALGLTRADLDGRPALSADAGVALYEEHGPRIFARTRVDAVRSIGSLLHEKYPAAGLEAVLADTFGEARLSQALTDVVVTAYELTRRETFVFSRRQARLDPAADFPIRVAARASAAAPTFFEPALVTDAGGRNHVFIDGGVFANNPSMLAYTEVRSVEPDAEVVVVSVGAGSLTRSFDFTSVRDWGAAQWARPMLDIVIDGVSEGVDRELRQLLDPTCYLRLQVPLERGNDDMDDVAPDNLRELKHVARDLVTRSAEDLDRICELLTA